MQITHDNDCEHRLGHDCTCGASSYQFDLAAARAEIERLTKERDEARAQVAAAYVAASRHSQPILCETRTTPMGSMTWCMPRNWLSAPSPPPMPKPLLKPVTAKRCGRG